jgi:hypothetical protein
VINALPFKAGAYEDQRYLAKARSDLADAKKVVAIGLEKVAARSAHYAAFHAAEARPVTSLACVATPNTTML